MTERRKWNNLFISNFLGVFNDNVLKNSIIFISVAWSHPVWLTSSQLISVVSACLVVPYLFFSPLGGHWAAIHTKKKVFEYLKLAEIPALLVAVFSFYHHHIMLAIFSVLIMGVISSLYSPSKYGLIRDIGGESGVSYGSGGFEMMAFLGILTGTIAASVIADYYNLYLLSSLLIVVGLSGYFVTRTIKVVETPVQLTSDMQMNPVKFLVNSFRFARKFRNVNKSVLGASLFWFIGSVIQMNLIIHSQKMYGATNSQTGLVMGVAALGIAGGTYLTGLISGKRIRLGLIIIGLFGMGMMLCILSFFQPQWYVYLCVVFCTTFFGGMFQVPNLSVIQNADLGRKAGDVFAYVNMLTFTLILIGAVLFSFVTYITNENSQVVFGLLAIACMVVLFYYLFNTADYRTDFVRSARLILYKKQEK